MPPKWPPYHAEAGSQSNYQNRGVDAPTTNRRPSGGNGMDILTTNHATPKSQAYGFTQRVLSNATKSGIKGPLDRDSHEDTFMRR